MDPVLDFVFGWLLNMSYFWSIMILSLFLAFVISIIYKYTTNQSLMKDLKTEIKDLQKQMKDLRHDPQKMMAVQKKAMETNMKYMMHSMKPMLFTFIPIIIIFGWMSAHFAYLPLVPGETFTTTINVGDEITGTVKLIAPTGVELISAVTQDIEENKAEWELKGEEGAYVLEYQIGEKSYAKDIIITNKKVYSPVLKNVGRKDIKSITLNNAPVKIINTHIRDWKIGWVGTYIIFSIIFSMIIRKWLKIY